MSILNQYFSYVVVKICNEYSLELPRRGDLNVCRSHLSGGKILNISILILLICSCWKARCMYLAF